MVDSDVVVAPGTMDVSTRLGCKEVPFERTVVLNVEDRLVGWP